MVIDKTQSGLKGPSHDNLAVWEARVGKLKLVCVNSTKQPANTCFTNLFHQLFPVEKEWRSGRLANMCC